MMHPQKDKLIQVFGEWVDPARVVNLRVGELYGHTRTYRVDVYVDAGGSTVGPYMIFTGDSEEEAHGLAEAAMDAVAARINAALTPVGFIFTGTPTTTFTGTPDAEFTIAHTSDPL